jgi:hypothetical protein
VDGMDYARQRIPRSSNNQPQALTVWIATDVILAETVTKAQGPGGKPISLMLLCFLLLIGTHSLVPAAKTYDLICRYM